MFTIGIDPHKGSHLAAVLDEHEQFLDELRVRADRTQRDRLLKFAAPYAPRVWAIEGARGLGALGRAAARRRGRDGVGRAGEAVGTGAGARQRVRGQERHPRRAFRRDRRDPQPAARRGRHRSTTRRCCGMLAKRHHDLVGRRTQSICRLHALLATMTAGGLPRLLSADRAARELRRIRPTDAVGIARRQAAVELLGEVRDVDRQLVELRARIVRGGACGGHDRHRRVRGRADRRLLSDRLHRRHHPVRDQRSLRPLQRDRTAEPRRRDRSPGIGSTIAATGNSTMRSTSRRSPRSRTTPPGRDYYLTQASRTTQRQRSAPRPQATHQRRRLPTAAGRRTTLNQQRAREGTQGRLLNPAWPANP